jgi:hypothetical protein
MQLVAQGRGIKPPVHRLDEQSKQFIKSMIISSKVL